MRRINQSITLLKPLTYVSNKQEGKRREDNDGRSIFISFASAGSDREVRRAARKLHRKIPLAIHTQKLVRYGGKTDVMITLVPSLATLRLLIRSMESQYGMY
jgi:hypothetical protein